MLIRQKAGWRLHHQAYLWPRRSGSSPLSSVTSPLLLPRRRRSNASTGSIGTPSESDSSSHSLSLGSESDISSSPISLRSESDSFSPPVTLRRSSSSSSCVEGEELSSLWSQGSASSNETANISSPSPTFSEESSPRKRKTSSSSNSDAEDLAPHTQANTSSDNSWQDTSELVLHKRRKQEWSSADSDETRERGVPVVSASFGDEIWPQGAATTTIRAAQLDMDGDDEIRPQGAATTTIRAAQLDMGGDDEIQPQDATTTTIGAAQLDMGGDDEIQSQGATTTTIGAAQLDMDGDDEIRPQDATTTTIRAAQLDRDGEDETSNVRSQLQTFVHTRTDYVCSDLRTRRDTRGSEGRGVGFFSSHNTSHLNNFPNLKGSNASSCKDSNSGNNNNNHLTHCDNSCSTNSLKESSSLRESNSSSDTTVICSRLSRMGVLCTEKHDVEERSECEGMSANSPRPASLLCFPPSPCESSSASSQECLKSCVSRKRSLDAALSEAGDSGTSVIRRRTQRSPSMGSINGLVAHTAPVRDKLSSDVAVLGQNGIRHQFGPNSVKVPNGYQNGTRPHCCMGLNMRAAYPKCMGHHHPGNVVTSTSSSLSQSPSSPSQSVTSTCHNGRPIATIHGQGSTASLPHSTSASILSAGSITGTVIDDPSSAKQPQTPSSLLQLSTSSLSSPVASASQQQQQHLLQPTQGSISSNIGSSNHNSSSNSGEKDGLASISAVASSSKCISASPNATVLSLRQRHPSSNSAQKSLSQPPSPQPSASMSCKSKSMVTSSSLPSLSTLVKEPVSPPTVACRWRGCSCHLDTSDLLEHIRKHVEAQIEKKTYACLWADCKVFNKPSWSGSWLERHVVSHSGHRPFKCILDNCGQRFHSQAALERHVNGHFTAPSQNGAKSGRTREEISHRMLQKRKRQMKRRFVQTVKRNDIFDDQTMTMIKQDLVSLAERTSLDLTACVMHTTFHGSIVGRRSTQSGSKQSLIEFIPSDVLESQWVPDENTAQMSQMSVPVFDLPMDTVTNLHNSLYKAHRFRKHRRK